MGERGQCSGWHNPSAFNCTPDRGPPILLVLPSQTTAVSASSEDIFASFAMVRVLVASKFQYCDRVAARGTMLVGSHRCATVASDGCWGPCKMAKRDQEKTERHDGF